MQQHAFTTVFMPPAQLLVGSFWASSHFDHYKCLPQISIHSSFNPSSLHPHWWSHHSCTTRGIWTAANRHWWILQANNMGDIFTQLVSTVHPLWCFSTKIWFLNTNQKNSLSLKLLCLNSDPGSLLSLSALMAFGQQLWRSLCFPLIFVWLSRGLLADFT